jgi:hypothetical protein
LSNVISTLPESDAAFSILAELEGRRWMHEGHAHPHNDPYEAMGLNGVMAQLRAICLTTAISHTACNAMLEQLEGIRSWADWGDVIEVRIQLLSANCAKP